MSFRADFYEALVWKALEKAYPSFDITYEPSTNLHNCGILCRHRQLCKKPTFHDRLIYTIPDFLIGVDAPIFSHVCYWDSTETSHAKFWRTISEVCELKSFVPNSQSISIIFEASYRNGIYSSHGWYPEFLRILHLVFDKAVFFGDDYLASDVNKANAVLGGRGGTERIYEEISENIDEYQSVSALARTIQQAVHPLPQIRREIDKMWESERLYCASLPVYSHVAQTSAEKIRNAILQIVLLMGLTTQSAQNTINLLLTAKYRHYNHLSHNRDEFIQLLAKLPVTNRENAYQFMSGDIQKTLVGTYCSLTESLSWFVELYHQNQLPLSKEVIISAIKATYSDFMASSQVLESLETIKDILNANTTQFDVTKIRGWNEAQWVQAYLSVPLDRHYNPYAELLIEAIGLGTYPLVRKYNELFSSQPISRNDLRALYSNRRSQRSLNLRITHLTNLFSLVPTGYHWEDIVSSYLHRKVSRITGPQSAINPTEKIILSVLSACKLIKDVQVIMGITIPTLASSLTPSLQLGSWRLSLAIKTPKEVIPIFISAMKDESDAGHKTREFVGHLRFARYYWDGHQITNSNISRAVAVLEGNYGEKEKRAFHLAGFKVCTIESFQSTLFAMGLLEND